MRNTTTIKITKQMSQTEMIFIHKPGADNMTLNERIKHISLYGQIRLVLSLGNDKAIITWYYDPTKPLNQQRHN